MLVGMAFTPRVFKKNGRTETADTPREEVDLLWDGWAPQSAPTPDDSGQRVTLGDLRNPTSPAAVELRAASGSQATDSTSPLRQGLRGVFAPRPRALYGSRWVFDGDSITINSLSVDAAGNQDRRRSWTTEMARLSMGRIRYVYNAAVAGTRLDQMLARFDTVIAPQQPDVVLLTAGTNDVGQARSMALWLADLQSYYQKCLAIGADLIVGEIWPTDDTSVANRGVTSRTWNNALRAWADPLGVQVIPWGRLANPVTGGWPTGWSTDNVHPTLLDSYSQIGAFGWAAVQDKMGPPVVRRATVNGGDLLANGFFTSMGAVTSVPSGTGATATTGTGSLPAGAYSYKVTGRTFNGESLPSAALTATLASTGQISVAATTPGGARGINIYRKGPSDTDWLFLTYVANGSMPYVDNGSATPGAAITGIDTSAVPTGLVHGNATLRQINGPWVFAEAGVRGNIVRLRQDTGGTADQDYFVINVTPGQQYACSCLVRGAGAGEGTVILRWKSGANDTGTQTGQVYLYQQRFSPGWGLAHLRVTAPAGVASVRVSFETDATVDYIDVAEVRFDQIDA